MASNLTFFMVIFYRDTNKKYHVMRFNGVLNVDFTKWSQVKLERENNLRDIKVEEEMPK